MSGTAPAQSPVFAVAPLIGTEQSHTSLSAHGPSYNLYRDHGWRQVSPDPETLMPAIVAESHPCGPTGQALFLRWVKTLYLSVLRPQLCVGATFSWNYRD